MSFAVAFQGAGAAGGQFDAFRDQVAVKQSLKADQSGFPEPLVVGGCSHKIEGGANRH